MNNQIILEISETPTATELRYAADILLVSSNMAEEAGRDKIAPVYKSVAMWLRRLAIQREI